MASTNLIIKKVAQKNLPTSGINNTIIFTDTGKHYITLKDGSLLQITDIVTIDTRLNMPIKMFNKTFYFIIDEKALLFYDGVTLLEMNANIDDIKDFFLDETGKLKLEFLDETQLVLKDEYNAHILGTTHLTTEERIKWNGKYNLPETGIPSTDLSLDVRDTLNNILDISVLEEHTTNEVVHTTEIEKQNNTTHIANSDIHVTSLEKTNWSAKYTKPISGIPSTDLADDVKTGITDNVKGTELFDVVDGNNKIKEILLPNIDIDTTAIAEHIAESNIHTTLIEKNSWSAKYDKPVSGIPSTDLADNVKTLINGSVQELDLIQDGKVKSVYLPEGLDLTDTNTHMANNDIHTTLIEKNSWSAKYTKPVSGIPSTDLEVNTKNLIEGAIQGTDLIQDGKVKPSYLPEGLDLTDANTHIANNDIHVTSLDKTNWSAKYSKPVNGIPSTDLADDVKSGITDNVKGTDLLQDGKVKPSYLPEGLDLTDANTHMANNDIHTTLIEKQNNTTHIANENIHVTSLEKTSWSAKYNKPASGIPKEDLNLSVLDHVNLNNKGIYSHADIDSHIENDIIHSNSALGRWDFEGSQFDTSSKTNIHVPVSSAYFELINKSESTTEYESTGSLVTTIFDTLVEGCPYSSAFYFGTYDRAVHTVKIYTRTGSTNTYIDANWGEWVLLDDTGNVVNDANRYVQLKVELLSADRFSTPQIKKIVIFYGRDIKDELKEAIGTSGSLSGKLDDITDLATHANRAVIDQITQTDVDKINLLHSSFIKDITVGTTQVVIPLTEHLINKEDYDYDIKTFITDFSSNLVPYSPKEILIKNKQITITFSEDVPFIGKIVIK